MTIKELKENLKDLPDTMDVFIGERLTEFDYGLVNSASIKQIDFMEEPNSKPLAKDTVLVLSED